jgi:hypothetical protein
MVQESADGVQSVTQNLSDGLRAVVMSFAGRKHGHPYIWPIR